MHKILRLFLAGSLILTFPATVFAAQTNTAETQEEGMLKPPGSHSDENSDSQSGESADEADESSVFSSGVDWSAANTAASPASRDTTFTVCIDPGHQGSWVDMSAQEPMAPGSSQTKNRATTGTTGNYSKVPEYEVNLEVSLVLEKELTRRGYKVVMTREDNDKAISNKERAEFATKEGADITVRVHANSDNDSSASGALTMAPTSSNQYLDKDIIQKSNTLASCIIDNYCSVTGLGNKGVISADNMTGTNWSKVPVAIIEMGFMSNQNDDLYITNTANHETMAQGIADGIDEYFSIIAPQSAAEGKHLSTLTDSLRSSYLDALEAKGEKWAVAAMDLKSRDYSTVNADQAMQSASVIKAFIMGAVYENLVYPDGSDSPSAEYQNSLLSLLTQMITVSDNDASNELVRKLGNGDFSAGAAVVNNFCQQHGYTSTHLGREFLAKNPTDDNYISASDCCRLLSDIYNGTLVNETASSDMLNLLKQQTRKNKIPSGLPSGTESANKTGELADTSLGTVENDIAIVFDQNHPYVLCVLSNNIASSGNAQKTIINISKTVYDFMTSQKSDK